MLSGLTINFARRSHYLENCRVILAGPILDADLEKSGPILGAD